MAGEAAISRPLAGRLIDHAREWEVLRKLHAHSRAEAMRSGSGRTAGLWLRHNPFPANESG